MGEPWRRGGRGEPRADLNFSFYKAIKYNKKLNVLIKRWFQSI